MRRRFGRGCKGKGGADSRGGRIDATRSLERIAADSVVPAGSLEAVTVSYCKGLGIRLDGPGTVRKCTVTRNGQEEPSGGILVGPNAEVTGCHVVDNAGGDIATVDPCILSDNVTT